jgi:hypothetical protein
MNTVPPFQAILIHNVIGPPVPITIKNLQVNAVCEGFHGTIKNLFCPLVQSSPPQEIGRAIDVSDATTASSTVFAP